MPIYMIIALDIVIIICFSFYFPTVICLPTVCYFLERSLLWNLRPPGLFSIILSSNLLIQKSKNTLLHFFFIYFCVFARSIYPISYNLIYLNTQEGLTTPLTRWGCKFLLFMCKCCLHSVAWFSYWIDNLGFITEGNTYLCCAASFTPLLGA